jgi:hypothetical protein
MLAVGAAAPPVLIESPTGSRPHDATSVKAAPIARTLTRRRIAMPISLSRAVIVETQKWPLGVLVAALAAGQNDVAV